MEELDIMDLRERYLHQEVLITDGSAEDGQYGFVTGVTAHSAEPLTVLFYRMGAVKHQNYYTPDDVRLTGGEWREGKERDQTVRCRKNRFDGLYYVCDGNGQHGPGHGTEGGAWAWYLAEITAQLAGKEEHGTDRNREVAGGPSSVGDVAGGTDAGPVRVGARLGERDGDAEPDACTTADEADGTDTGTADEVALNQPI